MNKYTGLSDFEINVKVAEKAGIKHTTGADKVYKMLFFSPDSQPTPYEFDPCNKPYDAWKIMMDNEISVTPSGDGKYFAFRAISFADGAMDYYKDEVATHENPLRAAMEVFLMMKDEGLA